MAALLPDRVAIGGNVAHRSRRLELFPLLVAAAALVVFLPAVLGGFVNWDDAKYTLDNPLVRDGLSTGAVAAAFANTVFGFWAPLTVVSYQCDVSLHGMQPYGFHLTNVLLHAAAAGLICLAFCRMTGDPWRSAAAALLFAVHPLRVESVAWIAERKDVLAMFFLALTLVAYEWYCRRPSIGRYGAVAATLVAGLLSKATLVTLPVLLLLIDAWPLGRMQRMGMLRLCVEKAPLLAVAGLCAAFTIITHGRFIAAPVPQAGLSHRLLDACIAFQWLLEKTLLPVALHPAQRVPTAGWPWWQVASAAALTVGWLVAIPLAARRLPALAFGLGWFLLAALPLLGLFGRVGLSPFADRFAYVPHIGLAIGGIWTAADLMAGSRLPRSAPTVVFTALMTAWIVIDEAQIAHWRDSEALWRHVLAVDEDNHFAHTNLGAALARQGRIEDAIVHFEQAARIAPDDPLAQKNLSKAIKLRRPSSDTGPPIDPRKRSP